ncbi:fungal specific transcription factor domain-containing protein [Magnaporthiopsis poae ATCC 64411]|uniref:Fungal specific transcription factor domain-containing protein n=1 Tax=Magnaporthiopsis poae (strain ATCC 64411 / 73-15) TaxID=644358 RepID=A0A0C4ECN7_MAGP6|nr:fungal specific transcription factor domain-containing protein [Magnaporthiopsis poae ATCC 64411]
MLQLHDSQAPMLVNRHRPAAQGAAPEGVDLHPVLSDTGAPGLPDLRDPSPIPAAETVTPCPKWIERKIDQIDERLGRIEQSIRSLISLIQNGHHAASGALSSGISCGPGGAGSGGLGEEGGECVDDDDEDGYAESPFEGESSITAHTVFASEFLHHAVGRTSLDSSLDPSMHSALSSLQQIVHMQRRTSTMADIRFPNQKPLPKGGLKDLAMPPLRVFTPVSFTLMCSFIGVEEFTEHCRRVYFATEDYSQASFIITMAGLFYILQERACTEQERDPALAADYQRYEAMCRDSLETVLAHFSLIQPAKRENVEALLLGSSYAVEIAKPSLAWQLNCAASQLCLTMGYHRALPAPSESQELPHNRDAYEQSKRLVLFWFTYTLDKGLALRLGRPSVIQDYDITVPWQVGPIREWEEYRDTLNVWIRHARVQGRMYDELYSPAALQRPMDARVRTVVELVAELRELRVLVPALRADDKKPPPDPSKPYETALIDILTKSDDVSFLSSIALCYRAIPPDVPVPAGPGGSVSAGHGHQGRGVSSTFSFECIDAARESMAAHQGCMQMMTESKDMAAAYVHWTILYAPFIPFIVLFCHVIETADMADLGRLHSFTAGLEGLREVSEPISKLHRLCNALSNVANMYLETKKAAAATQAQMGVSGPGGQVVGGGGAPAQDQTMYPVGMEFDMYLRDLGFMPGPNGVPATAADVAGVVSAGAAGGGQMPAAAGGMEMFHNAQLGDWFSTNLSMMGMLERDLSGFSPPNNWPATASPHGQHQ